MKPIFIIALPFDISSKDELNDRLNGIKEYLKEDYFLISYRDNSIEAVNFKLLSPFTNLEEIPEDKLKKIKEILKSDNQEII